ncbi:MAG TPA: hypothetical protein VMZ28_22450 [Kofleriaceae bacterium]|nr:hypothetical protein [Kofleriaceae bacterium]
MQNQIGCVLACLVGLAACEQQQKAEDGKPATPAPATPEAKQPDPAAPAATAPATPGAQVVTEAPPPKLHDQPVERRLYSDRIEASSFLWTDWNKFQENYHPNYIMDGDPATAWVEGADTSGKGEWVRVHLSPVEGATVVRLRVQNGYHKSKTLHEKNARLKEIEVKALPSGFTHKATLKDDMEWQEIAFEQPAGKLEAIELSVASVFEGSKYTDLCVSDLEVFVTGLNVENPAFEKAKLDELLAWKKNRLAAAAVLGSKKATELPILPGYRLVKKGDAAEVEAPKDGENGWLVATLDAAAQAAKVDAAITSRARAALAADFAGWVQVQVVAKPEVTLPPVDGLYEPSGEELVYGGREDAFMLPTSQQGLLLSSAHLSTFDVKDKSDPRKKSDCKEGKTWFMRPPRAADAGPVPTELVLARCVTEETREGEATYATWQLLEFDKEGNLVWFVGPQGAQWLDWTKGEKGMVLSGGGRVLSSGGPVMQLVDARVVAKD